MFKKKNNIKNDKENNKYCAITEQGDLGLGAEVLNDEDQKILNEQYYNCNQQKNK